MSDLVFRFTMYNWNSTHSLTFQVMSLVVMCWGSSMVVMSVLPFHLLGLINLVKSKTFMLLRWICCIQWKRKCF